MNRQDAINLLNARREFLQNRRHGSVLTLDGDFCDRGRFTEEKSLQTGLNRNFDGELKLVERAIGKVAQGKYGICEGCRQSIPDERLKSIPETPYCVGCCNKIKRGTRNGRTTYRQPVFANNFATTPA
jgi:RNA polymerase-binding transcription factor DksA